MTEARKAFNEFKKTEAGRFAGEDKEFVACPVCDNSVRFYYAFKKGGHDFRACQTCGLLMCNPQLPADVLDAFYAEPRPEWDAVQAVEYKWNLENKYTPGLKALGAAGYRKLLDVGCGDGQFLDAATAWGWDAVGVDLNPRAVHNAVGNGHAAYVGTLEEARFRAPRFDVVTMWGVLEHLEDPNAALRHVGEILNPGGRILVFVPNGDSLLLRIQREACATVSWKHLWYFSPTTLGALLAKHGFEVESQQTLLAQEQEIEDSLMFGDQDSFCLPAIRIIQMMLGHKLLTVAVKA